MTIQNGVFQHKAMGDNIHNSMIAFGSWNACLGYGATFVVFKRLICFTNQSMAI